MSTKPARLLVGGAAAMSTMSTKPARLLVVESSCYVNQTSKVACSGEQLLSETNDRFAMRS